MSITIKLDAPALRALIADDAEFKLELQRSVTAEVVRNLLMKDAAEVVKAVMPTVIGQIVAQIRHDAEFEKAFVDRLSAQLKSEGWSTVRKTVTPALKEAVAAEAEKVVKELIEKEVAAKGLSAAQISGKLWDQLQAWLEAETPQQVLRHVDREVERRVAAGVEARLAALKAAI